MRTDVSGFLQGVFWVFVSSLVFFVLRAIGEFILAGAR